MKNIPMEKMSTVEKMLVAVRNMKNTPKRLEVFAEVLNDNYDALSAETIDWMRHSELIAKEVFGLKINPSLDNSPQGAWDTTTPVLTAAMLRHINPADTVICLGPGPFATEACVLSKEKDMPIIALEIWHPYIESGEKTAEINNADIRFVKSDVYSAFSKGCLPEDVDYIAWNPPYVPSDDAKKSGLYNISGAVPHVFDGGPEGTILIERSMKEMPETWKKKARLLLGVNTFKVSSDVMRRITKANKFNILKIFELSESPSKVFILQHA